VTTATTSDTIRDPDAVFEWLRGCSSLPITIP
jgi:hypothetical protein